MKGANGKFGINQQLLKLRIDGKPIDFGVLDCGYTPIDLDTFVMNNDDSKKELVGRTYAGVDGLLPDCHLSGHPGLLPGVGTACR